MLISKTPLRVSLFGGGTDYPAYYEHSGRGGVVGFTINKYIYTSLLKLSSIAPQNFRISYREIENANAVDEIKHPIVREVFREYNVDSNYRISIMTNADLPGQTGLGSSSAFTVGMIAIVQRLLKIKSSASQISEKAIYIERVRLKEPVGVQDQHHAAIGGFRQYAFLPGNTIISEPVNDQKLVGTLNSMMVLVYTSKFRKASDILKKQDERNKNRSNDGYLSEIYDIQNLSWEILNSGSVNEQGKIYEIAKLLNASWKLKTKIGDVSNPVVDDIIGRGFNEGALGSKLLGAGGTGFVLFIAEPDSIEKIIRTFGVDRTVRINIETKGVIVNEI